MSETKANTPVAELVWNAKYRASGHGIRGEQGIHDTWSRVALALSAQEPLHRDDWRRRFEGILLHYRFLPGGRILAGAGTGRPVTLFNCFAAGTMQDSISGIFSTLAEAMLTLQAGGGVGCDFSTLRPAGSPAQDSGNVATGPVSFLRVWESACATMAEGFLRRGAMMATLRCDHPDIERFIDAKRKPGELRHFNLSVLVSDAFMRAVEEDAQWPLMFPLAGRSAPAGSAVYEKVWSGSFTSEPCLVSKTVGARGLWERLCKAAFECGDPGVIFIDRVAQTDNLYYDEVISATNPCGEVPLPPHGACNLGSINLTQCVQDPFSAHAKPDLKAIAQTTVLATRMLDNVYECSHFPLKAQEKVARASRRIGLGITGLADALAMLGVRYGSDASLDIADTMMRTLCHTAYRTSIEMVKERGVFPAYRVDKYVKSGFVRTLPDELQESIAHHGIHNSHLIAIAPAGSISLLAGNVSSGIEPIHALHGHRHVTIAQGSVQHVAVRDYAWDLFRTMHGDAAPLPDSFVEGRDVDPVEQLKLQSIVQAHVDQAISKTINVPIGASYDRYQDIFLRAWKLGLKGCTLFRPRHGEVGVLPATASEAGNEKH